MICLRMGKTYMAKTLSGDFKVTTSKNPLLSQQAVRSKGIPVPYTNLQLNPYSNTQLFTNRENLQSKNPSGDFKVTIPENPLLSQQAVISKGIPIPYTNLQLNSYSNTQLDLFYSDNLSFQCTAPSM